MAAILPLQTEQELTQELTFRETTSGIYGLLMTVDQDTTDTKRVHSHK